MAVLDIQGISPPIVCVC